MLLHRVPASTSHGEISRLLWLLPVVELLLSKAVRCLRLAAMTGLSLTSVAIRVMTASGICVHTSAVWIAHVGAVAGVLPVPVPYGHVGFRGSIRTTQNVLAQVQVNLLLLAVDRPDLAPLPGSATASVGWGRQGLGFAEVATPQEVGATTGDVCSTGERWTDH